MKTVSQLDANGYFVNTTIADESPLEPGVFHLPAGCIDVLPPIIPEGKLLKWNSESWVFEDIPETPQTIEDEEVEMTYAELRRREYPPSLDYLDAWVKNDEQALEEYRQKCLAVKAKYPKPS